LLPQEEAEHAAYKDASAARKGSKAMSVAREIPEGVGPRRGIARRFASNVSAWHRALVARGRVAQGRNVWAMFSLWRLIAMAAPAVALVVAVMFAFDGAVIGLQRVLPHAVVAVFAVITDFGLSVWVLVPTSTVVLLIAALASPRIGATAYLVLVSVAARFGFIFAAVALPGLTVSIVKRLIGRARPYLDSGGPFEFSPFAWKAHMASLPSGHGTTVFATAVAVGALYPRLRPLLWGFAVIIAISRVAVSEHYPSDVLAGALVGIFGALLIRRWFASRRVAFSLSADGTVRALPGPSWRRLMGAVRSLARA
jgi:membrane-associated phospholipid phosphatase